MGEMKARVGNVAARLSREGWPMVACLFADYTILLAENAMELQRLVEF